MTHTSIENIAAQSGTFQIGGDLPVVRLGYGTMQLTGEGVWGPPKDHDEAIRVLRRSVELGINFFDTADSYGPTVAEELLAEALHPYADDVVIATKAGLTRTGPGPVDPGRPPGVPAPAGRAQPAPPRARADRPLPAAPHRRRRPARGPGRRARRPAGGGQDPAHRSVRGLRRPAARRPGGRADRDRAEPVQLRRPLGRAAARGAARPRASASSRGSRWRPASSPVTAPARRGRQGARRLAVPARPGLAAASAPRSMLPIPGTSSVAHLEDNTAAAAIELTDEEYAKLD